MVYAVKIFLASENGMNNIIKEQRGNGYKPYILKSFMYCNKEVEELLPLFGDFMLDSGAFTFMGGFDYVDRSNGANFDEYIERYASFIVRNKIEKFFELDVDVSVGYEKVKEYRKKIEQLTNRQVIPVWHSNRGVEDSIRCCDEYKYVALGGIVGGEWNSKAEKAIPFFIQEAHKRNAKIHGLGFTKLTALHKYHFDSVDSISWLQGSRNGYVWYFDGKTMRKAMAPKGYRLTKAKQAARNNFNEWTKFQQYAETHY